MKVISVLIMGHFKIRIRPEKNNMTLIAINPGCESVLSFSEFIQQTR